MRLTKNYKLQEFISKNVFDIYGEKSVKFLCPRLIELAQKLRDNYGALTINNWLYFGDRQYSGFRQEGEPYRSITSQHSFGRAIDIVPLNIDVESLREDLLKNLDKFVEIGGFGIYKTFVHLDIRYKVDGNVQFFEP